MSQANTPDLTVPTARDQRDALASRVDVLDKVGVLRTLADDLHVTTDMVAEFYEVPVETIRTLVQRNSEEMESDGYHVLSRADFEVSFSLKLTSSAPKIALFPRRAVLRVGMLLRDSRRAREIRDYLLNTEAESRAVEMSEEEIVMRALEIQRGKVLALTQKNRELVQKVEEDRPLVERAKTHAVGTGNIHRTEFFREVKAWAQKEHGLRVTRDQVFDFLSTWKLNLFVRGNRTDSGQATAWAIEKGYADSRKGTAEGSGWNYATGVLTPLGQEYAWDRIIRYVDANGNLELPKPKPSGEAA